MEEDVQRQRKQSKKFLLFGIRLKWNRQLSEWFHLPIQPDQIVLSHSPLREISTQVREEGQEQVGSFVTKTLQV
jgi:hypothetical protein